MGQQLSYSGSIIEKSLSPAWEVGKGKGGYGIGLWSAVSD